MTLRFVAAATTVALVLGGCSAGDEGGVSGARLGHVHGLAVNPGDGDLYAGSHYGLFRLRAGGEPELVGGHVQDFMGFTVAGEDHFLASGHPGEHQGGPPSVGLMESTDAGKTWRRLSLSGEADFHSLAQSGNTTFGLNAMTGQLLASADRRTWEVRSTERIADFAVNPDDPRDLIVTTEAGPQVSHDGAKTLTAVPHAPLLALVDWADDGTVIGLAPDGTVYASADAGMTWEQRGALADRPGALGVESATMMHAATGDAIWRSTDGGRTFTRVAG